MRHITMVFALCAFTATSQNMISNGSFESYTALPNSWGQWDRCVDWLNPTNGTATPDYLHMNGSGIVDLPNSNFGTVTPYDGSAVMGLVGAYSSTTNREYVSKQLDAPLTIGLAYDVSYWISNGSSPHYGGLSCSEMGMLFTTNMPVQNGGYNIPMTPQVVENSEIWSTGWTNITSTFVADSAYEYMTIGNFGDSSTTTTTIQDPGATATYIAYYFYDKIEITPSSTNGLIAHDEWSEVTISPIPAHDFLNVDFNAFVNSVAVQITDMGGRILWQQAYQNVDHVKLDLDIVNGVYFVDLRSEDKTTTRKFIKR